MPEDIIGGEGADTGESGINPTTVARDLAKTIATRLSNNADTQSQPRETGSRLEAETKTETPIGEHTTPEPEVKQETTETTETAQEETVAEEEIDVSQLDTALSEAGIDLGYASIADVPADLLPAYARLATVALENHANVLARQAEAQKAIQEVDEFSKRLDAAPDKVLLALAVNKPEVFKKVMEVFTEMETDPRMKEIVTRELQSEARLAEAERRERVLNESGRVTKAQQVIAATKREARIANVPYELAESVVALAVQANGSDLDVSEVAGIIQQIAKDLKVAPRTTKVKIATPAKQAAVKTAPTASVAGSEAPTKTVGDKPVSPGLKDGGAERQSGGGLFRSLIKQANSRLAGGNKE